MRWDRKRESPCVRRSGRGGGRVLAGATRFCIGGLLLGVSSGANALEDVPSLPTLQRPPASAGRTLASAELPARVRRVVLHTPGGPSYDHPDRGFFFYTPLRTQRLWRRNFGTHWILWTDGTLWPRHPGPSEPQAWTLPLDGPPDETWRQRLARQAAPVYSHVHGANDDSVGIEVAHSGRSGDPFPPDQLRALAWLLRALIEMSDGRLGPDTIVGHKDLDGRPAYVRERCSRPGCTFFADREGRPYHRRVDPPEELFVALQAEGLAIPRLPDADANLRRAESLTARARPRASR